ncbi:hypothetical protein TYRP_013990 [Tyrophagus putrescentiae]|nr:hypothetical protein TYRP_013990 [Tyrophagus putrescentiae]
MTRPPSDRLEASDVQPYLREPPKHRGSMQSKTNNRAYTRISVEFPTTCSTKINNTESAYQA